MEVNLKILNSGLILKPFTHVFIIGMDRKEHFIF